MNIVPKEVKALVATFLGPLETAPNGVCENDSIRHWNLFSVKTDSTLPDLSLFYRWTQESLAGKLPAKAFAWGYTIDYSEFVPEGETLSPLDSRVIGAQNFYLLSPACIFLLQNKEPNPFALRRNWSSDEWRSSEGWSFNTIRSIAERHWGEHMAKLETIGQWEAEGLLKDWQVIYSFSDVWSAFQQEEIQFALRKTADHKNLTRFNSLTAMEQFLRSTRWTEEGLLKDWQVVYFLRIPQSVYICEETHELLYEWQVGDSFSDVPPDLLPAEIQFGLCKTADHGNLTRFDSLVAMEQFLRKESGE